MRRRIVIWFLAAPLAKLTPLYVFLRILCMTVKGTRKFSGLPRSIGLSILRQDARITHYPGEQILTKPAEGSTVIGKSVIIRGELSGNEDLYMDGDIEGTIALPESRLTVGPNARILADISARDVIVFGTVTGNMHASGRIDLRQSATVNGDIVAGRLSIEESAILKGRVELKASAEAKSANVSAPASASEVTAADTPLVLQPNT